MKSICVFCGSHVGKNPAFVEAAAALGKILAEKEIRLVYGGSDVGLMGTVANHCMKSGGYVIGVMPQNLVQMEVAHPHLSELKVVDTMHQRKALMAELSDGFIAMPGGIGTLEEILEMFTWLQLGIHNKPVALLNVGGFYDQFQTFLHQVVENGFLQSGHLEMMQVESQVDMLVSNLIAYKPKLLSKWADKAANKV